MDQNTSREFDEVGGEDLQGSGFELEAESLEIEDEEADSSGGGQ
jgi:hypothetical protein